MSTIAESGIISVAFSLKSAMSGSGYINGTQINASNTVALSNAALSGAYMAEVSWIPATTNKYRIDFGKTTNQFAAITAAGATIVNEGWLGSVVGTSTITSLITAIYVELSATATNTHKFMLHGATDTYFMGGFITPGDCFMNVYQGQDTEASNASSMPIHLSCVTSNGGGAAFTFKFVVCYK